MSDGSTVIFLDYFDTLERAVPFIDKVCNKLKCEPIVVSSNFDTTALTKFSNLKIIYFDELLSKEDYGVMGRYVFNLTETWFAGLKRQEGITEYAGIQYGVLPAESTQRLFTSAIKTLQITLKIIERFQPHMIILIGGADIFQNLDAFIKEKLSTLTLFIEVREKDISVNEVIKSFWRYAVEAITNISDSLMRMLVIRNKKDKVILVDCLLYFKLKDLSKEFFPYLYLIGKGLRIRLRLIRKERHMFAPLLVEDFFELPNVFSPFYRYWMSIKTNTGFQNNFVYKNLPIWRILEKIIRGLIIYDFPRARKNIIFLKRLYKDLRPRVIVLREAVKGPERAIVLTAKQAGIPTLVIQHGILAARNVYTRLLSDKIALWGKAGIDWYGAYGNDTSKCVVTGKPEHDLSHFRKNNYKEESQNAFLKIGADPNKETIFYVPGNFKNARYLRSVYYTQDLDYVVLGLLLNIAECFSQRQLIIKVRPFDFIEMDSLINSRIKNCPNVFVVRDIDPLPLIANSSLIITSWFSSLALDAVILDKPVITINFYKRETDPVPFAQRGVALSVTKPEDLYPSVKQVFEDASLRDYLASNRESFIYDYAYKIDGKTTERVLNLIKRLYDECTLSKSFV